MSDPLSYMYILGGITAIVILLILSAFFSASETSLLSISRKKLRDAISSDRENMNFENQLKASNRYLTVILVLNNVVNILISSLSTVILINILPKDASDGLILTIVTIFVTVIIVVFGEITPKLYARENAASFFNISFPIVKVLDIILRPVVFGLNAFANVISKTFTKKAVEPFISSEDILFEIDAGKHAGVIEEEEGAILKGALKLKNTYVREIMVPRIEMVTLESNVNLKEAIKKFDESKYSRLPVYSESIDHIIGICYSKDIISVINEKEKDALDQINVRDVMRPPYFVPETKKIDDLLHEMRYMKMHIAIVVDEYGGTAGLVTLEDVLEELTGEIFDEYDVDEDRVQITKTDKNTYIIDGLTPLNSIEREIGISFPESEFETIGGYLLKIFERVPRPGEIVETNDFTIKILESNRLRIIKIELKLKGMTEIDSSGIDK
ncbi:hemolysin family protein [Athalassotoga sp.]|uniref:hemolysin family protein n=1 Tax=Athalassotoga sp. TaxID=2022597 RepID=UPI003D024DA6